MKEYKFLVSAIVSTYNSEKFIKGRIEDLLRQTIANQLEIIIVNSNSQENEKDIVKGYLNENRNIKYIETETTETIYKAWNRGIAISEGKFITNANTDDRLCRNALEILASALLENPSIGLVYADQYISDVPNIKFEDIKFAKTFNRIEYNHLNLFTGYLAGPQSMWRAQLHFEDNIWFNDSFEVSGDYDFICRVAEKYDLKRVPGILGVYYKAQDGSNKEFQNYNVTHKESYEVREKYLRRYLRSLSKEDLKNIENQIKLYKKIPHNVSRLIRKLISIFKPEKQIPSREFMFLLASTIEEVKGNDHKAIEYCEAYLNKTVEGLIQRQFNRLSNRITFS